MSPSCFQSKPPKRLIVAMRCALVGAIFLALSGCVTAPLKTQEQREGVVEATGFDPSEVELLGYCFFEEVDESDSETRLKGARGIIAMTDEELCLMKVAMEDGQTSQFLKIPLWEIAGVNGSPRQVQIRYQNRLFVLVAFRWSYFHPDYNQTNKIYELLVRSNAPQFETSKLYSWSILSPRSNAISGIHQVYEWPTIYGDSLQGHRQREREIYERQNRPFTN